VSHTLAAAATSPLLGDGSGRSVVACPSQGGPDVVGAGVVVWRAWPPAAHDVGSDIAACPGLEDQQVRVRLDDLADARPVDATVGRGVTGADRRPARVVTSMA
jgi:hypothetical protein